MIMHHDPDAWETIISHHDGGPYASSMCISQRPRAPEVVARIKTERRIAEEEHILRKADAIRARRAVEAA